MAAHASHLRLSPCSHASLLTGTGLSADQNWPEPCLLGSFMSLTHLSHALLLSLELGRMKGWGDFDLPWKDPGPSASVLHTWHPMPPWKSVPKCKQKLLLIECLNSTSVLKRKKKSVRPSQDIKCESEVITKVSVSLTPLKILVHYLLCGVLQGLQGCRGTRNIFYGWSLEVRKQTSSPGVQTRVATLVSQWFNLPSHAGGPDFSALGLVLWSIIYSTS